MGTYTVASVARELAPVAACQPIPIYLTLRDQKCGSWLACDGGLPADAYLPDAPRSNCGSGLARECGLTVNTVGLGTSPFLR